MRASDKQPDQMPNPLENSIVEELTARFMSLSARPLSGVKKSSPIAILYAVDDNTLELSKTVRKIIRMSVGILVLTDLTFLGEFHWRAREN